MDPNVLVMLIVNRCLVISLFYHIAWSHYGGSESSNNPLYAFEGCKTKQKIKPVLKKIKMDNSFEVMIDTTYSIYLPKALNVSM